MPDIAYSIEDILSFVEDNFTFLHVGRFLATYIKKNDLSSEVKNIKIRLPENQTYTLQREVIEHSLSDIYLRRNQSNIMDYFVDLNAFRGITMAMSEGIKGNKDFKDFLNDKLKNKYNHFEAIISFIRNTLSHNIDNEIILRNKGDFEGTKKHVLKNVEPSGIATLKVVYSEDFPEMSFENEDYGFEIVMNFNDLQLGQKFTDIITEWQLFMIAELCRNLVHLYRNEINT